MTDLDALLKDAPVVEAPATDAEAGDAEDPRWLGFWLLAMAQETRRAATASSIDSSLSRRLGSLLSRRPAPDASLGQLLVDPPSVARRATVAAAYVAKRPGPIVALGDDDGVSLALALLGLKDVHAIDVDPRVLEFLRESADACGVALETHRLDVSGDVVPHPLRHAAAAVITDPFRSSEDAAPFIAFALAMLRSDEPSWLLYADHERWSFDLEATRAMLEAAGLVEIARKPALHRYPLDRRLFPRLPATAEAIGVRLSWLIALVDATAAWSDLFVWERPGS